MGTSGPSKFTIQQKSVKARKKSPEYRLLGSVLIYTVLVVLALLWTLPTLGLLITSIRPPDDVNGSGWWTVLFNPEKVRLTLDNYRIVLGLGLDQVKMNLDRNEGDIQLLKSVMNTIIMTIPSTVIPIFLAAIAAYAFAWMRLPASQFLFTVVVALLVVPFQIALIPVLKDYNVLGLNGTFLGVWLANTGFGLSLATYLLYNYISTLPRDIFESAFIDGASHFTVFNKIVFPLSLPALASFAIFQFLWVWNGVLVPLVFMGEKQEYMVLPQRILQMLGTYQTQWNLLTAGAFISMLIPLVVFLGFQRYFVRGMMAGSVKG